MNRWIELEKPIRQQYLKGELPDTYLLLFFDTFELIEYNPITAVLRSATLFPDRYQSKRVRAIVAGRNALDWTHQNWVGRRGEIVVRTLPPFSKEEMTQYLKTRLYISAIEAGRNALDWTHQNWVGRRGEIVVRTLPPFSKEEMTQYLKTRLYIFDIDDLPSQKLEALYKRTEGRPILVGLAADVLNKRIKDLDTLIAINQSTFEASLVEEINRFDDPSKVAILSMAHVYHRFDANFLHRLMSWPGLKGFVTNTDYRELAEKLTTLSFVRRSGFGEDFVLHDEMRRMINLHCWKQQDPQEDLRRELSSLAINYYNELIDAESGEEKKQSYIVERLFHELFIDTEKGLASFERHFNSAISLSLRNFARALFQELWKFEHRFSREQLQIIWLSEVKLLRQEEKPQAAFVILTLLENDSEWAERHRSDLLYEKGSCYLQLSQFDQAIECFAANLEIEQSNDDQSRYARLLDQLGYAYRRQGRYAEAMHFYEEALKVQRNLENPQEYATLLNNIGNVQRLQGGRLEEALSSCKQALSIRRDLFNKGKASEYYVGSVE